MSVSEGESKIFHKKKQQIEMSYMNKCERICANRLEYKQTFGRAQK